MVNMQTQYEQLLHPSSNLNISIEWQIPNTMLPNLDVLTSLLYTVVQRNPNLRTVFKKNSTGNVEKILVAKNIYKNISLAVLNERPNKQNISFKLDTWPLFRVWVDQKTNRFGLAVHHIISDGVGATQILKDIGYLYAKHYIPILPKLAIYNDEHIGTLATQQKEMMNHKDFKVAVNSIMSLLVAKKRHTSVDLNTYRALDPIIIPIKTISIIQHQLRSSKHRLKASHSKIIQWLFSWCRNLELPHGPSIPIRKQRMGIPGLPIGYHARTRVYQPPYILFDFPKFCAESIKNETTLAQIKVDNTPVLDVWTFEGLKQWCEHNTSQRPIPEQVDEFNYLGNITTPPPPLPAALIYHQFRTLKSNLFMGKWRSHLYDPQCVATVSKIRNHYQLVLSSYQLDKSTLNTIKKRVEQCVSSVSSNNHAKKESKYSYLIMYSSIAILIALLLKFNQKVSESYV